MPLRRQALLRFASAALCMLSACAEPSARVDSVDMQDFQAPAMFRQLAIQARMPFLVELPPRSVDARFDLRMSEASLDDVLVAIGKLDPQFQQARRGDVLVFWPSGKADLESSPYSTKLEPFSADAGAGEVVRLLLVHAGIAGSTNLVFERVGLRRPVKLDLRGGTLRDAFIEIARQAHLGFVIEPGDMNVVAVPE